VENQEEAKKFYTEKLGFEVRFDATMENGLRWLTVGLKAQPDLEIVLMEVKKGGMMDEESERMMRTLLRNGKLGGGVLTTSNCRETYEELKPTGGAYGNVPAGANRQVRAQRGRFSLRQSFATRHPVTPSLLAFGLGRA
jgi:hypothetical protein